MALDNNPLRFVDSNGLSALDQFGFADGVSGGLSFAQPVARAAAKGGGEWLEMTPAPEVPPHFCIRHQ